jgi:GNAT superfamily N-acetyltransferase
MPEPVALDASHVAEIYRVINDAATAYRGAIPADRYHEPYMPRDELEREMAEMQFHGVFIGGRLVGVMGVQDVQDVTLVRHAYVESEHQGQGIGSALLRHVEATAGRDTILIGTWATATWAIRFYQEHGYTLVGSRAEKDAMLRRYWHVPDRQIETSIVLRKVLGRAQASQP